MFKESLRKEQKMCVGQAAEMAGCLIQRETRGPGDLDNAMRRLEAKYGVPYSLLWSLRYRKPKDILLGAYQKIQAAYQAECQRQAQIISHEITVQKAIKHDVDPSLLAEIETVLAKVKAAERRGE